MKKRLISLLLALCMVLALLPAAALAADGSITVSMSIFSQGTLATAKDATTMLQKAVTVTDENGDGNYSLDEALNAAHVAYAPNGASDYVASEGSWGYSVSTLWGVETSALGFYRNHSMTGAVNEEYLSEGDLITAFIYADQTNYSDRYAYFTHDSLTVCVDTEFEVTLMYKGYDSSFNLVSLPQATAPLGTFGVGGSFSVPDALKGEHLFGTYYMAASTDTDGNAKISFTQPGLYWLTAQFDSANYTDYSNDPPQYYLVPPVCKVTVLSAEEYEKNRVLEAAAELLTWSSFTSEPADAVTAAPTLPTSLTVEESKVVSVSWCCDDTTGAMSTSSYGAYVERPTAQDVSCTLTATLGYEGIELKKEFPVTVKAEGVSADKCAVVSFGDLMGGIAATYTSSTDAWTVLDMAAYGRNIKGADYAASSAAPAALAEAAIGGTNTSYLDALKTFDPAGSYAIYTTPYALLAYDAAQLDDTGLTNTHAGMKASALSYLGALATNGAGVDEVAPILSALASSYGRGDDALDAAVDAAVVWLSGQQLPDGTFSCYGTSNANSTALVITALSALGIDAHTDARFIKNYTSAVEGLMSFALRSLDGFGYKGNVTKNALSTEQGFRALVSYARYKESGRAYNLYLDADLTANAPADPGITATVRPIPPTPTGTVSVQFTLTGDSVHGEGAHTAYETWIARRSVAVPAGATVGDVFAKALADAGFSAVGASSGYVTGITAPSGVTLSQLSNGVSSGWMFRVNGELPSVGMNECVVSNGDDIEWFYIDDWNTLFAPEDGTADGGASSDVASGWAAEEILWVQAQGLMQGVSTNLFAPARSATRAMAAVVLYRLAGSPAVDGTSRFSDVADDSWCADAVIWAAANGILLGGTDGAFQPTAPVSRQQLAAMLYRFAQIMNLDVSQGGMAIREYSDYDTISTYALPAAAWAVNTGLMQGANGALCPRDALSRAQLAVVLFRFCAAFSVR